MFLYLNLAAIGSLHFSAQVSAKEEEEHLSESTDSGVALPAPDEGAPA
jgi:hypothetical protein